MFCQAGPNKNFDDNELTGKLSHTVDQHYDHVDTAIILCYCQEAAVKPRQFIGEFKAGSAEASRIKTVQILISHLNLKFQRSDTVSFKCDQPKGGLVEMLIPRSETFGTHSSISPEKIGRAPGFYGLLPLTRTPPISKIACKTLVLSYLNLRVRSYRFETSRYVIKLKHFRRSKDFLKLFFFKLL